MAQEAFQKLSWADLEAWVGSRSLQRGRSYKKRVSQLCLTAEDGLIAWVQGGQRYATRVSYEQGLDSSCSCPIGGDCKHAVAVVLHYLELVKQGKSVPVASGDDERIAMLELSETDGSTAAEAFVGGTQGPQLIRAERPAQHKALQDFLAQQTKTSLEQLLFGFAQRYPLVRQALEDQLQASQGVSPALLVEVTQDVARLAQLDWHRGYRGSFHVTPEVDLEQLKSRLELLLGAGHYDELIILGHELLSQGKQLVEESHDEGIFADTIQQCMDIVLSALAPSHLSTADKLIWLLEVELINEYDLADIAEIKESLWESAQADSWAALAEHLQGRLKALTPGDYLVNYRRDELSNWLTIALTKAGQDDSVMALLEREAVNTHSYPRFVEELIIREQLNDAETWIKRGIEACQQSQPRIAGHLREQWRNLREQAGDVAQVAALRAEDFFYSPSLARFNALKDAAEQAQLWPKIEPLSRAFLQHGERPSYAALGLPVLDLPPQVDQGSDHAPYVSVLLDLALFEENTAEVIYWFDTLKSTRRGYGRYGYGSYAEQVAKAVQHSHPERTIEIWQGSAEALIAETKVSSYQSAAEYLKKLKPVMADSWEGYISSLRAANSRKPRCVEILDGLLGRSILGE